MLEPRPITATSGHRAGQVGLAVEQKPGGWMIRFYDVHQPKLTDKTAILQSLHKGYHASVSILHESEFEFETV